MMTRPMWVTGLKGEPRVRDSLLATLAERIAEHEKRSARSAKDMESVMLARGAIEELEYLRRLLEAEEKEDAARGTYNARSGRPRAGKGATG